MNILMATNTYTPHVGGVARSVQSFTDEFRRLGHRVLVIAPEFDDAPQNEEGVVRVPAIKNFNASDFCVPLVMPGMLMAPLQKFQPEIIHCHHPFLLGSTSLRVAAAYELPIVFTLHTRYETYTHYLPFDNATIQRFAVELAARFCALCDAVVAPSQSMAKLIKEQEVDTLIEGFSAATVARRASGTVSRSMRLSLATLVDSPRKRTFPSSPERSRAIWKATLRRAFWWSETALRGKTLSRCSTSAACGRNSS
jgi:glycosyltransferase involved in cell wall biosynthesis